MESVPRTQAPLAQQFALLLTLIGACVTTLPVVRAVQSFQAQDKFWEFDVGFHLLVAAATGLWTLGQASLARATASGRRPRRTLVFALSVAGFAPAVILLGHVLSGDGVAGSWLAAALVLAGVTLLELMLVRDLDRF